MKVEVAYALAEKQYLLTVELAESSTVEAAIKASGVLELFPAIHLQQMGIGIFSQRTQLSTILQPGDRVEIYRPLTADPKAKRRQRAREKV